MVIQVTCQGLNDAIVQLLVIFPPFIDLLQIFDPVYAALSFIEHTLSVAINTISL